MPKIYKYLGIVILFHSREHDPIHVHGRHGGHESKAEIFISNGNIEVGFKKVRGKTPLKKTQKDLFESFVVAKAEEIVQKWTAHFVWNTKVELEEIQEEI